jgi:hypothetical protein
VRSSVILCRLAHSLPSPSLSGRLSSCAPTARVPATHCNRHRQSLLYSAFSLPHPCHRVRVEIFLARVSPALVPTHSRPRLACAIHPILPPSLCTVSLPSAPSPSCSPRHPAALPSRPRRMRVFPPPSLPVLSHLHIPIPLLVSRRGTTVGVVSSSPSPSLFLQLLLPTSHPRCCGVTSFRRRRSFPILCPPLVATTIALSISVVAALPPFFASACRARSNPPRRLGMRHGPPTPTPRGQRR